VPPFQGFTQIAPTQGFGRFAAFALGFAVPRFQRWRNLVSLTRMPFRAFPRGFLTQGFGRFAAFALGFAVPRSADPRFQRWRNLVSLTRMPSGTNILPL